MSLINEALKKAQKQRETTPASPASPASPGPGAPGTPPPPAIPPAVAQSQGPFDPPPPRARNQEGSKNSVLIAGAFAIVAVSVAATVYFLREPARSSASATTGVAPAAAAANASAAPAAAPHHEAPGSGQVATANTAVPQNTGAAAAPGPRVMVSLPGSAPAAVGTVPAPAAAIPPAASQATVASPAATVASPAAPSAAEARPALPEAPPVKATFRIQAMIDKFRISGIRLSDTESRVILNDHLFRANDVVEPSLGLRLVKIDAHTLTFIDGDGNSYQKRF